ncbi:MAG TPA: DNA mismatch repair protein [Polyangiaceae bacterium]|nr:DNA mismatch repair protein [Polyangiaceae bacterium]
MTASGAPPDLLHAAPIVRIDHERTKVAVAIAFAGGNSGGLFAEALERATVAPSPWSPRSFQQDLYLQHFVQSCFAARLGNHRPVMYTSHIVHVLAHPPADPTAVDHRRRILAELSSSPDLRLSFERLYGLLCRFRGQLEGVAGAAKWDANRRQLDTLRVVKELFDCMADGFASSKSGLRSLATCADSVRRGEPFLSMCDLLRYDDGLATVSVKVGVGADGRIRGLQIDSISENTTNPFVASPLRRWLAKGELFLRGFSFGDGEVMARLIYAVFDGLHDELVPLVQLLGEVEVYLGALGFQEMARAAGLPVCLPQIVSPTEPRVMLGLFNPLLLAATGKVVPCDIHVDRNSATVLVTGPNSGGKTRLLQSLALSQLLAQSGLFVPARTASLALAPGLVVSLIQETRADQGEGRLGMELLRIRELFEDLQPGAMVILDELCSGTNPSEGEEIFELVVRMLARLNPQVLITTHFLAFAARLEGERKIPNLRFLQVELGADQQPTYQFAPGVARTSLACHTAARLGVTGEQLAALVDRNLRRGRDAESGWG